MKQVGWFVWWTYKSHPDFVAREFYCQEVRGFLIEYPDDNPQSEGVASEELFGEVYLQRQVERLLKKGTRFGMEIDKAGYEPAFVQVDLTRHS